jgi:hypothetical protein
MPGIGHRAFGRAHREVGEAIGPFVFLRIIENRFRIEIADLTGNPAVIVGGIEARDLDDPAASFEEVLPKDFEIIAEGRNDPDSGDDDSAVHNKVMRDG